MGSHKDNRSLAKRLKDAEVYDDFCDLLFAKRWDYDDLLAHTEEKWGVITSISAISRFADSERSSYTLCRARTIAASVMHDDSLDLDAAQRRLVQERLFGLAASPDISEKSLLRLRELEIKAAELENDRRRIQILEGKMKSASDKLDELRDPDIGNDEAKRLAVLDAVDEAMGMKKKR